MRGLNIPLLLRLKAQTAGPEVAPTAVIECAHTGALLHHLAM
jgi:hypothetical protein